MYRNALLIDQKTHMTVDRSSGHFASVFLPFHFMYDETKIPRAFCPLTGGNSSYFLVWDSCS